MAGREVDAVPTPLGRDLAHHCLAGTIEADHPRILAQLCAGKTVLDVGCGPGHLVEMLRERDVNVVGIDPYLAPRYRYCFMEKLEDQPADRFDVVVCREVLEHVPVREWGAFLHHLFRVARERVYLTTRFTPGPMHPFDLDLLAGSQIVVRRARPGEKLVTLDDVERELAPEDLLIADGDKAVGIAGVMGSASAEVSPGR